MEPTTRKSPLSLVKCISDRVCVFCVTPVEVTAVAGITASDPNWACAAVFEGLKTRIARIKYVWTRAICRPAPKLAPSSFVRNRSWLNVRFGSKAGSWTILKSRHFHAFVMGEFGCQLRDKRRLVSSNALLSRKKRMCRQRLSGCESNCLYLAFPCPFPASIHSTALFARVRPSVAAKQGKRRWTHRSPS
jgi:hypothetical protein